MPHPLLVHLPDASPEPRTLEGPCTAGGSRGDALLLVGLPPATLRLEPCDAGLVIEPAVAGLRVAGRAVAPGARRLLRPGERATILGCALELPPSPAVDHGATRVAAAGLLRGAVDGAGAPPGPHLLILTGAAAGARLTLGREQILGRSRRADLRLDDPEASRLHARIRVGAEGVTAEDLGAKNGLSVNGIRVERGPRPLRHGDELGIGETALALVVPGAPGAALAAPAAPAAPPAPPRAARAARLRRTAAALLALSALALALAGG